MSKKYLLFLERSELFRRFRRLLGSTATTATLNAALTSVEGQNHVLRAARLTSSPDTPATPAPPGGTQQQEYLLARPELLDQRSTDLLGSPAPRTPRGPRNRNRRRGKGQTPTRSPLTNLYPATPVETYDRPPPAVVVPPQRQTQLILPTEILQPTLSFGAPTVAADIETVQSETVLIVVDSTTDITDTDSLVTITSDLEASLLD